VYKSVDIILADNKSTYNYKYRSNIPEDFSDVSILALLTANHGCSLQISDYIVLVVTLY